MKDIENSVTVRWLAREADVSVATVSRALRQLNAVARQTRERILELVERHRFVPDGRAATFSSKRTGVIGLIVPTISNSIYAEFMEAIQSRLQAAGLRLLIANANYSSEIERDIIRMLIESRVEGVILTGYKRDAALYQLLRHYQIPFVVTWSTSPKPSIPAICFDNREAATQATRMMAGFLVVARGRSDQATTILEQNNGKTVSDFVELSKKVAGGLGFEPRLTESESVVLPLDDPPIKTLIYIDVFSNFGQCFPISISEGSRRLGALPKQRLPA
jgi:ABC-type sugar transport system substrate-binding protein